MTELDKFKELPSALTKYWALLPSRPRLVVVFTLTTILFGCPAIQVS